MSFWVFFPIIKILYDRRRLSTPKVRLKVMIYIICEFSFVTLTRTFCSFRVIFVLNCTFLRICNLLQISYLILTIPTMASNLKKNCRALKHSVFYCIENWSRWWSGQTCMSKRAFISNFWIRRWNIFFSFIAAYYTITALILSSGFSIWFQHLFIYVLSN